MPSPFESSFKMIGNVPVHYDRDPHDYGTRGRPYTFRCREKLKETLERCFSELFAIMPGGPPELICCGGTTGDGENAHGQGLAFDLDALFWADRSLIMNQFFSQKFLYIGINAHLYLHFSQVLNFYYPAHDDHFHVDSNFSFRYRPESSAQTFFVQACLKYLFDENLGRHGQHRDGVDGVAGETTRKALARALADLGLSKSLQSQEGWFEFIKLARARAFSRVPSGGEVETESRIVEAMLGVEAGAKSFLRGEAISAAIPARVETTALGRNLDKINVDVTQCVCGVLVANGKSCDATKSPEALGYSDNVWSEDGRDVVRCLQHRKGYGSLVVHDQEILKHFRKPVGTFHRFLVSKIK